MSETPLVKNLKGRFEAAMLKDRLKEAADLLVQLERAESGNPRWPHRLGDVQRRMGNQPLAIEAYERAVDRYAKTGFLARAVAMAKTITGIDPSRSDVLSRIQQDDARDLKFRPKREAHRPAAASLRPAAAGRVSVRPAPLSSVPVPSIAPDLPLPIDHDLAEAASALTPAADVAEDEIRFVDQEEDEVVFDLTEDELSFAVPGVLAVSAPEPDHAAERLAVLPLFALFTDVPREALLAMAEASELVELAPGATVIRTGDKADALYAIVEGSVRVIIPHLGDKIGLPLREGDVFGEACLLTNEPRHADIVVAEQLTALRIPKRTLDALIRTHAEVGSVLMNLLTRRLLVNLLRTSPLFAALDRDTRREVARLFEVRRASSGTILVEEQKRGDGLYIPLTGKLEVTRRDGGFALLPAGSVVGQATFLGQGASTCTVRTVGDTVMLRLASSRLMELVSTYPTVLEELSAVGADDVLA